MEDFENNAEVNAEINVNQENSYSEEAVFDEETNDSRESEESEEIKAVKRKAFWSGVTSGILVAGIILTSVFSFYTVKKMNTYKTAIDNIASQAIFLDDSSQTVLTKDVIKKIESIYQVILQNFLYEEDIDIELMRENFYRALVVSLGDVYSQYYSAEEFEELTKDVKGTYYGIGSTVMIDNETGLVVLAEIFEGSGAAEVGMKNGDLIYAVDDEVVAGLSLDDVVAKVRGEKDTYVKLTAIRESEYLEFNVPRREFNTTSVYSAKIDENIGYIRIREFDSASVEQFSKLYDELLSAEIKGLVLDLRSNPGGSLDGVLGISEKILPAGLITYMETRDGTKEEYYCGGKSPIEIPMVVLVNSNSASAAELLTGAIKDYGVGTIIGTTTYGKGIVQDILSFKDGSGIKITNSSYYTPNGICIHKTGIEPNIEVKFDTDKYYEEGIDNQLEYAIEYLGEQIK